MKEFSVGHTFEIRLTPEEWKSIDNPPNERNPIRKLKSVLINLFAQEFPKIIPSCALAISYHNVSFLKDESKEEE